MPSKTNEQEDENFDIKLEEMEGKRATHHSNLDEKSKDLIHDGKTSFTENDHDGSNQGKIGTLPSRGRGDEFSALYTMPSDNSQSPDKTYNEYSTESGNPETIPLFEQTSPLNNSIEKTEQTSSLHHPFDIETDRKTHEESDDNKVVDLHSQPLDNAKLLNSPVVHVKSTSQATIVQKATVKNTYSILNQMENSYVQGGDQCPDKPNKRKRNCNSANVTPVVSSLVIFVILLVVAVVYLLTEHLSSKNFNSRLINSSVHSSKPHTTETGIQIDSLVMSLPYTQNVNAKQNINISWESQNQNFIRLDDTGRYIYIAQNATYSIGLSLNLDSTKLRKSTDTRQFVAFICLRNSRHSDDRCQRQLLAPFTAVTVCIHSYISLWKGDTMWVSMYGAPLLYDNPAGNRLDIIKFPSFTGG